MAGQPPTRDSHSSPLSFDELIALLVAFLVMGSLLWWSLGRKSDNLITGLMPLGGRAEHPNLAVTPAAPEAPTDLPAATLAEAEPEATSPKPPASTQAGEAQATAETTTQKPAPSPAVTVPAVTVPTLSFPDVPPTHWAYPFVSELAKRGMIAGGGDGDFKPDQPVNRAQYAALLKQVLSGPQQGRIPFSDVQGDFWANQAIGAAVETGFLKGYPDKTFQPTDPMTKMQVLLSLANGFQLPKPAATDVALQSLSDRDQIPAWARPAVAAATQSGVVVNYPDIGQFHPGQAATRAEVVAMLYQALQTTGKLPQVQSPYIVKP
ncbi:MAG: S-layer homology domain-containing protein [Cyanobacteria bacterium REEB459]|nr:S-layer homology domain-containing protein [Cyanobacteria bacterium REEB459]